jgi:hypothetical protein
MSREAQNTNHNNALALTYALASPWPELKKPAEKLVRSAMRDHETFVAAAESLGINRSSLRRLRISHPELFQ